MKVNYEQIIMNALPLSPADLLRKLTEEGYDKLKIQQYMLNLIRDDKIKFTNERVLDKI